MYHAFGRRTGPADPHNLFVTGEAFEAQLTALLRRGHRPLDEAGFVAGLERGSWPGRSFFVTVDDGYVSTVDVAAPVLSRLGVPATVFVLPGMLGATSAWMADMPHEPLLDAEGIYGLRRHGIGVGLHGLDHRSLPGLPEPELHRQIVQARDLLAGILGDEPALFAYPYGDHDRAAREAVADAGFRAAFAIYAGADRFAFPRVDVNSLDTPRTFRLKSSHLFPLAKTVLDRAPGLRRATHSLVGRARR